MTLLQTAKTRGAPSAARDLEVGQLVARAVRGALAGAEGSGFMTARARRDVADMDAGAARRSLTTALDTLTDEPDLERLSHALVCYGGVLERRRHRLEAVEAFETALVACPDAPDLMLHAARAHRKAGNRDAALSLYRRVREQGDARLRRFSDLGTALLEDSPCEALGRVIAEADAEGDREAAAVGLEERARLARQAGRPDEAMADYTAAGLSYEDRRDRVRVAHTLADLLLACGDLPAAREALLAALELSGPDDRGHAVQRLRSVMRAQGDEVGLRRWQPAGRSSLVSLMPAPRPGSRPITSDSSRAAAVRQWRERLETAEPEATSRG